MFKSLYQVFIANALITTVVAGIMVALVQEKWVFVPVVALSIGITQVAILWRWQTRSYAREIRPILSESSIGLKVFLFLGSLFVQGIAIASMAITYLQVHESVHICFSTECGKDYINLVGMAGAGGCMEVGGMCASILAIYGIIRRPT